MTLGLPEHLAGASLGRALTRAGHSAAAVCLLAAMAIAAASVVDGRAWGLPEPRASAMLVLLLLAAQAAAQAALMRWPNVTLTVVTLVVGGGVAFALTELIMQPGSDFESTNNAMLALPRVALVLLGGAGFGSRIAITWAALGWGIGEAATLLAVALNDAAAVDWSGAGVWVPNVTAAAALVIMTIVRTFDGISRRSAARQEAGLYRATQQTRELAIRHDYELRAIARLHDTALSHLIAVATAGSGPIAERLRSDIRHDLALIVGRDWAIDHADHEADDEVGQGTRRPASSARADAARGRSPLAASTLTATAADAAGTVDAEADTGPAPLADAIDVARHAGLEVHLSGDPSALRRIDPARREALEAAVAQCLMNVVRHAGVDEVEVAVGPGDSELTVAVVDGGAGFDVAGVPPDRIGLRTSIRGRIEQEGGTVQVWSRPGVGTTVLLSVPVEGVGR
ncbi:Sensor histidine kinase LiaS [Agromyces sp. NDB4Y10]|uniref:sensor histidine kinase n=1 Tax=Agromyces sp. NDB4Y10 TaxID=1775951 RepID=UPI0007B1CA33|nr:ATP-binding protein [Agromyces sp. NDB4Y10]KZE92859.1 Sensor histidine kinase LiaS [Agromyces sp. NDB4Y10]